MENYSHIERSAFRKGEYVGYAQGVWRIKRHDRQWRATHMQLPWVVTLNTLRELNDYFRAQSRFGQLPRRA